ncbi:MAG: 4,5-DOPA dioxygenase extradiol [Elusimicrobiota bacterium]|nr:4,5-DOPA dioxygenase extradiol [Elusimicrobiota bacterium]
MDAAASAMPAVFIGHGDPMHALRDNAYTRTLAALGRRIGRPEAIVCVSAHWLTDGAWATHMEKPRTIHDFHGFPRELFEVRYDAPGSPATAERLRELVAAPEVRLDDGRWGLDHGAWSVLRHMYPAADVPVVQLSIDPRRPAADHFELGRRLAPLREEGVLILGSGNVVHNLAMMEWSAHPRPFDWAVEFDAHVKRKTQEGDYAALTGDPRNMPGGELSVPTPEHWYPYLYALGAAGRDEVRWEYEGLEYASISMRCASFGPAARRPDAAAAA